VPAPVVKAWAALVDDPPLTEHGGKTTMDVSTNGSSPGDSGCVVDSELCPDASTPPDVVGADSTSSSLCPSSEDNNGGKSIGLSITAIHLAIGDI
jgi:hypothetical protein